MTRKPRPLVRLLLLLLSLLLEQAVIRTTFHVCVAAFCKWAATALVESLFSHHALPLYVFTAALNVASIGYGIHLVLETLEEHLKIPVQSWLEWLYNFLMPKGGGDGQPRQPPEKPKKPARRKAAPVKRRKAPARRRTARAALDPAAAVPAAAPPAAEPRRVPRRNKNDRDDKNQALES